MKRSRGLWISVIFVAVLVVASTLSLAFGVFKPVLGLDLEGGLDLGGHVPEGPGDGRGDVHPPRGVGPQRQSPLGRAPQHGQRLLHLRPGGQQGQGMG